MQKFRIDSPWFQTHREEKSFTEIFENFVSRTALKLIFLKKKKKKKKRKKNYPSNRFYIKHPPASIYAAQRDCLGVCTARFKFIMSVCKKATAKAIFLATFPLRWKTRRVSTCHAIHQHRFSYLSLSLSLLSLFSIHIRARTHTHTHIYFQATVICSVNDHEISRR